MKKRIIIGQFRFCDFITMTSTLSAIIGIILCLHGHTNIPFLCLFISCLCDGLDGLAARRRKNSEFETCYGVELDSLSDMVAFGIFPIVLALTTVKYDFISYVLPFYGLAGLIRLTYFNALHINKMGEKGYFRGVPITTISMIYPFFYFIKVCNIEVYSIATIILFILLAILFVTNIKVKKPNWDEIIASLKSDKKKRN